MRLRFYPIRSIKNRREIFLKSRKEEKTDRTLDIISTLYENGSCVRRIVGKREIWRVSIPGLSCYVKITFQNNLLRKILTVLKLSKSHRELERYQKLKDIGIVSPEVIAYGREYGLIFPQKEYIIIQEVEKSRRLKDVLLNDFLLLNRGEQKKLISDFAGYMRKLHDNGVIHPDPNLGNFLVKSDDGKNQFYLLDLADVEVKPCLTTKERLRNLALLNLNFFIRVTESLRYYFFKKYCADLIETKSDILYAIRKIETITSNLAYRTWNNRIKRCLKENDVFRKYRSGSLKIHFKKNWGKYKVMENILSLPDSFLDKDRENILKNGRTVKAAKIDIGHGKNLFLKRYNRRGFFYTLKYVFRSSKSLKVWIHSYGFELRGIPVPSSVAYMEDREFRILKRSYIINEFISDAKALSSLFRESVPSKERQSIMKVIGRELGKMHRLGCLHGDLKWSNILVKMEGDSHKCFFVDLDGSEIKKNLSLSKIFSDLSRFYIEMVRYEVNREEQEAFLELYYRYCSLGISYETLVNKVIEKGGNISLHTNL